MLHKNRAPSHSKTRKAEKEVSKIGQKIEMPKIDAEKEIPKKRCRKEMPQRDAEKICRKRDAKNEAKIGQKIVLFVEAGFQMYLITLA